MEDAGDRLLILHNDGDSENFEIATAAYGEPTSWTPLVPHRADTRLLGYVDAFADFLVIYLRRDGLTGLRVLPRHGGGGARGYRVFPSRSTGSGLRANPEYQADQVPAVLHLPQHDPGSVYDYDLATGELTLLEAPARSASVSSAGEPYRKPEDYEQHREWAVAGEPAPRCRSRWSAARATPARRRSARPACCTATVQLRAIQRPWLLLIRVLCRCSTGGSSTRSRTSAAAARWAGPGTPTGSCCTRRTPSPTSSRVPGTWSGRAGRPRTGWSARGGSAGGLLMGAVANMAPDAFVAGILGARALRRRAEHHAGPNAAADRDRMGGVGRNPAARPRGLRVHEVVRAVRERHRAGLPAGSSPSAA